LKGETTQPKSASKKMKTKGLPSNSSPTKVPVEKRLNVAIISPNPYKEVIFDTIGVEPTDTLKKTIKIAGRKIRANIVFRGMEHFDRLQTGLIREQDVVILGYPFKQRSEIASVQSQLNKIFDIVDKHQMYNPLYKVLLPVLSAEEKINVAKIGESLQQRGVDLISYEPSEDHLITSLFLVMDEVWALKQSDEPLLASKLAISTETSEGLLEILNKKIDFSHLNRVRSDKCQLAIMSDELEDELAHIEDMIGKLESSRNVSNEDIKANTRENQA